MVFVVDASVTLAWCFQDETTKYAETVLDRLEQTQAVVPPIWPLAGANVLLMAERKRRLSEAQTTRLVQLLSALPVTIDAESLNHVLGPVLALGREHRLTAYDASYIELAMRQGLSLATQDLALKKAAVRAGVSLVE